MRGTTFLTLAALALVLASPAIAQGGMGGMGGGMGGPPPGGARGKPPADVTPTIDARPAAAIIPVTMRLKGILTLAGVSKTLKGGEVTSDQGDVSGLYATRDAQLTLDAVDILTTGAAALVSDSHDYGINSALLIDSGSSVKMSGGRISTQGQGANGAYVGGEGSVLVLKTVNIATSGTGAYGIDIRPGASLEATDVSVTTESDHAPAVSLQARGRPTQIIGGNFTTKGPSSPALALSGDLEASQVAATAGRADGVAITGLHRVSFADSDLSGGNYGVMIYDAPAVAGSSMSAPPGGGFGGGFPGGPPGGRGGPRGERSGPDAGDKPKVGGMRPVTDMMMPPPDHGPDGPGLVLAGGKLSAYRATIYVSNIRTRIDLDNVALNSAQGIILKAAADQWGELGRNGGDVVLNARHQTLTGDFVTDAISHITLDLNEGSHLTGKATRNTDITLDATSTWTLTGDSNVGKLNADPSQINSQGHTLSYDKYRNPALNNQTLPLPGGGQLVPSGL